MATPQERKQNVMTKVNSVMAALNLYPDLNTTNTQLSFSPSLNPMDLLIDFFKTTKGYDWLINTVSKFIAFEIPVLELAIKGVLLSNIRVMLSCSVNPFITEDMIKDGIVFDINQIDLLNMFLFSPIDKSEDNIGRYLYFGCDEEDGIKTIDDVKQSRDFNAVLWYCKNTPGERVVWRRNKDIGKPYNLQQKENGWLKQVKSNGIATIEYNGRASGLSDAEGNASYFVQEPINNCIHVYIGCCAPVIENDHSAQISDCTVKIKQYNDMKKQLVKLQSKVDNGKTEKLKILRKNGASQESINYVESKYNREIIQIKQIMSAIDGIDIITKQTGLRMCDILDSQSYYFEMCYETFNIPGDLYVSNILLTQEQKIDYMNQDSLIQKDYPSAKSNYYYKRPLFEWNTDYITSMKLFDEKVITSQLLDGLTGCLQVNGAINITPQRQFIRKQIQELVTRTIETDDSVVSDCFFSFTNDTYNHLLNEVELNRINLTSTNDQTINSIPSAEEVMSSLNSLSHDASKEELKSVINGSLINVTGSTKSLENIGDEKLTLNFNYNFSIIDNLLNQLVYVMVSAVLQPKIYVLLMANTKILGGDPNFDLNKFIHQFSDLFSQIIKEIRDNILDYFNREVVLIMNELVKVLAAQLTREQYQAYITLLTHCLDCFKLHKNSSELDWMTDDVNYADITELNQEENQEC